MATRRSPSYCVEIVGQGYYAKTFITTLYTVRFDKATQDWWYSRAGEEGKGKSEERL
jgi:hypothetical protein